MKRSAMVILTLTAAALAYAPPLCAQKLAIGERAPEISVGEWLTPKPHANKARLIYFYHSASPQSAAMLPELNRYAENFADWLEVVVIARETKEKVQAALMDNKPKYYAAIDSDGKTFAAYGVKVVPFGVIVDAKGKIMWFGNPAQLDNSALNKLLGES